MHRLHSPLPASVPSRGWRHQLVLAVTLVIGVSVGGCATMQTSGPSDDTSQSGPALTLLYTEDGTGLRLHDAQEDTTATLVSGASYSGIRTVSPSGRYVAFSYEAADSTSLAVLDRVEQTLSTVDTRIASATYSAAWHPSDERLAFAYYRPAASGTRGPGEVFVTDVDGSPRSVGCRAAREVLHWLPNGSLATRNDDKLYIVAPDGCATRAAADAERMHEAAYAPEGTHLAYLYRELTYNREANEYTPDTSLYLADGHGQNATELFGSGRRVRHLHWSPDGSELAFDARAETSGARQIAIYRASTDRTVYLTPPSQTSSPQTHPRWSPSGTHVAFTVRANTGARAAVRVDGQNRGFGRVNGAVGPWIDDRTLVIPGPDSLRVQTLDGATVYERSAPQSVIDAWRPTSL